MSRQVWEFYSINLEITNKKAVFGVMRLSFLDFMFWGGYNRALRLCLTRASNGKQTKVFTPNAEMLAATSKDASLLRLLKQAELPLPDGIGVYLGARLLGHSPLERTNGIDFAEKLLSEAAKNGMKIFLLGAKPGVSNAAARKLQKRFKGLRVAGTHHGYFEKCGKENDTVLEKINRSGAEILFVCFGFPDQERWIAENLPKLENVKIAAGLGGSLDVWSGKIMRAPSFFRKVGLEWAYRIAKSPERLSRLPRICDFFMLCGAIKISNSVKQKGNLLQNR